MNIHVAPPFLMLSHLLAGVDTNDLYRAVRLCTEARQAGKRFFFIGNGGSAAIASHMAADWLKTAEVPAMCFNDPALITCVTNDYGYERAFSFPLAAHCSSGD